MSDDLTIWADRLEAVVRVHPGPIDRVRVMAETGSTQDAALNACGSRPGLLLTTGRQLRGRGRLGRKWVDQSAGGVAVTMVLPGTVESWQLSMLAGVAAAFACERFLHRQAQTRWPNDVLEPGPRGRKLGGVLVEVRDGLALVGIGINVKQNTQDWPTELAEHAVSLSQLGAACERIEVLEAVLKEVHRLWPKPAQELVDAWRGREWLIGRRCVIAHDGQRHAGVVRSIDPLGHLVLATDEGDLHLPSASASVVSDT